MEAFEAYLSQFPHYTPKVFEAALPYLSIKELAANEYFLSPGNTCRNIAFVESGLLRQYYLHQGKEVTNCFCKENTIATSYKSLVTQQESDLIIQAVEPCRLIVLSYESLQTLYEQELFWQQVGRLAAEQEYVTTACHHRFLKDLSATERYQQMLEEQNSLIQRVPLTYLASYLQIAPETLSRIRKKLSRT